MQNQAFRGSRVAEGRHSRIRASQGNQAAEEHHQQQIRAFQGTQAQAEGERQYRNQAYPGNQEEEEHSS